MIFLAHSSTSEFLPWPQIWPIAGILFCLSLTVGYRAYRSYHKEHWSSLLLLLLLLFSNTSWWTRGVISNAQIEPPEKEAEEHFHLSQKRGQIVMWGQYHLEVSRLVNGELRCWLSDEKRNPISARYFKVEVLSNDPDITLPKTEMQQDLTHSFLFALPPKELKKYRLAIEVPGWHLKTKFTFDDNDKNRSLPIWCSTIR